MTDEECVKDQKGKILEPSGTVTGKLYNPRQSTRPEDESEEAVIPISEGELISLVMSLKDTLNTVEVLLKKVRSEYWRNKDWRNEVQ